MCTSSIIQLASDWFVSQKCSILNASSQCYTASARVVWRCGDNDSGWNITISFIRKITVDYIKCFKSFRDKLFGNIKSLHVSVWFSTCLIIFYRRVEYHRKFPCTAVLRKCRYYSKCLPVLRESSSVLTVFLACIRYNTTKFLIQSYRSSVVPSNTPCPHYI